MIGLYHPARTCVHAAPAGLKLLVLFAAGTASFFVHSPLVLGGAAVAVALCYALARIPVRLATRQVLAIVPFAALLVAAQGLLTSWTSALLVGERVVVLVTLASLITLTTRTSDMVRTVEWALRPFARLGVRPERVGLMVAMTIRFVPVIKEQADLVRAAQKARGVERSVAFLTPLLVRTLRLADGLGEALEARGLDSRPDLPEKARQPGAKAPAG
ncbi:energy-coupling factor transporter transmembrane component T family protein [Streptomyces sp. NPDC056149]|uniref:energy-coupling factor transporter transmembrane component T family protein n=1 Tax=unclassified Streptomyces TaxID=2593676 RepID=UPI002380C61B|nr:energy-coupling factor transporter transmembrane protein EcfT [Streptomyces sp. WZ-12]